MSRSSVGVGCKRATVMSCLGTSSSSTWIDDAGERGGTDHAVQIAGLSSTIPSDSRIRVFGPSITDRPMSRS